MTPGPGIGVRLGLGGPREWGAPGMGALAMADRNPDVWCKWCKIRRNLQDNEVNQMQTNCNEAAELDS